MPWLSYVSSARILDQLTDRLTLMFDFSDHFADHGLHNTYIAIERTAEEASKQRKPDVQRESHQ